MESALQFKDNNKIKKKFNLATSPRYVVNSINHSHESHSIDEVFTLNQRKKSKFSLLNGQNKLADPTTRIVIGKRIQKPQNVQLAERIVAAKKNQVDQLRRALSQHKIRIQQTYTSLNLQVCSLKQKYTHQSDRLAGLASQIQRFL